MYIHTYVYVRECNRVYMCAWIFALSTFQLARGLYHDDDRSLEAHISGFAVGLFKPHSDLFPLKETESSEYLVQQSRTNDTHRRDLS